MSTVTSTDVARVVNDLMDRFFVSESQRTTVREALTEVGVEFETPTVNRNYMVTGTAEQLDRLEEMARAHMEGTGMTFTSNPITALRS